MIFKGYIYIPADQKWMHMADDDVDLNSFKDLAEKWTDIKSIAADFGQPCKLVAEDGSLEFEFNPAKT